MQKIKTNYSKLCPKCNKPQYYKNQGSLLHALNKNSQCKKCLHSNSIYLEKLRLSNLGLKRSEKVKENMFKAFERNRGTGVYSNKGKANGMFNIRGQKHPTYHRKHTLKEKIKMRKPRSEDFKLKMRLATLKRIERMGGGPNFNRFACEVFKKLNELLNWNGVYATNQEEFSVLGYKVDYYEPTKNLIIEWDEESHYLNEKLNLKCIQRQKKITDFLNCKFIRIRQKEIFEKLNMTNQYLKDNPSQMRELANQALVIMRKEVPIIFDEL